jgi:hypothetical protein
MAVISSGGRCRSKRRGGRRKCDLGIRGGGSGLCEDFDGVQGAIVLKGKIGMSAMGLEVTGTKAESGLRFGSCLFGNSQDAHWTSFSDGGLRLVNSGRRR